MGDDTVGKTSDSTEEKPVMDETGTGSVEEVEEEKEEETSEDKSE